jgi:hypothetical protein
LRRRAARPVEVAACLGYPGAKQLTEHRAMVDRTILALPVGKKVAVPRFFKRLLQIALALALTAALMLVVIVGNGLLVGRAATLQGGINVWLAFIKRPDILATMTATAIVTVLFVYWMRDRERK